MNEFYPDACRLTGALFSFFYPKREKVGYIMTKADRMVLIVSTSVTLLMLAATYTTILGMW